MTESSTLHRREQNFIVRIGKSEAEITNHKRLRSRYCTVKLTTDKHEASRGFSATAELRVLFYVLYLSHILHFKE